MIPRRRATASGAAMGGVGRVIKIWILLASVVLLVCGNGIALHGQTTSATLSGTIMDAAGKVVPNVDVAATNVDTGVATDTKTNGDGIYVLTTLQPGRYRVIVTKQGFKQIALTDVILNVQDTVSRNFNLAVGAVSETVTVEANGLNINTTNAAVSTIVDRQFVENMPLNGRSFQDLLTLAPGVVQFPVGGGTTGYSGEISVNGQRTEGNYFTVDGVSVNTGTLADNYIGGGGFSGGLPGETVLGTTQSLVPIDALQEFRASTSTYSAEYGRTPGGQFSFSTRSGTNTWHGSAYDYFRNDAMDANNWFNKAANPQVPRLPERQNDFGGILGGPITIPGLYAGKDKTFFFFSYEGLRLTVPQPFQQFSVPDATLRQQAPAALQPFLNAFPIPNGGEDGLNDGLAFYNLAYSSPSSLDNVGIRIDHSFGDKLQLFGRYASTPSSAWSYYAPALKKSNTINVRTLTLGATSSLTRTQANELRFNITQNNMNDSISLTNLGGAIPLDFSALPGPNGQPFPTLGSQVVFYACFGGCPVLATLANTNAQRQYNLVDTYTWARGAHQLKFGIDWRRLTTFVRPINIDEIGYFASEASLLANVTDFAVVRSLTSTSVEPVYHNFSAFVQDEWKSTSRLALSLGLRWDINPAPENLVGPSAYTVDQVTNLATTQLAPVGTPLWKTDWHGFAPRLGVAYQLHQSSGYESVLRTGFGLFYDMGNTQGSRGFEGVGFSASASYSGMPFPLISSQLTLSPPSVAPPYNGYVVAFDPNLKLPYTMQWNFAVEQGLGARQTLTMSYIGSGGRRLLSDFLYYPSNNPKFSLGNGLDITANRASSGYNALQVKYQKNLSHGFQGLASYTWSHSIDNASSNFSLGELLRASADFDIRHNLQAALTYDVPGNYSSPVASRLLKHWGLDTRISVRSALPIDIVGAQSFDPATQQSESFHPNLVPGQPIYLYGSQYPGGLIINYNAFTPAADGVEGDVGRNSARGFDAVQVNVALRRDFAIYERLRLQFRAEAFNLFNHAIFGSIYNQLTYGPYDPATKFGFGGAYNTLNSSLGGLNSLYQIGGPRSLQLMLKLEF